MVTAKALLALADGAPVRATARSLGVHQDTVRNWAQPVRADRGSGCGVVAPGRGRKRQITAHH